MFWKLRILGENVISTQVMEMIDKIFVCGNFGFSTFLNTFTPPCFRSVISIHVKFIADSFIIQCNSVLPIKVSLDFPDHTDVLMLRNGNYFSLDTCDLLEGHCRKALVKELTVIKRCTQSKINVS